MGGLLQNGPLSSPGPREGHFGATLTHFWPKWSYCVMCFCVFTFSGTSQLKHLVLRALLEDVLNMLIWEEPSHTFDQSGATA